MLCVLSVMGQLEARVQCNQENELILCELSVLWQPVRILMQLAQMVMECTEPFMRFDLE